MMHSGKPPALKVFANNGGTPNPSSKDPSSGVGLTQQQPRAGKSENCDPNLSVGGKKKALQKVVSSPSILQLPEQSDTAGAAHSESAAGGLENHSKEVNRPAGKLAFSSPRKAALVSAHSECDATDELERQSKLVNRPASKSSIPSPSKAPVTAHSECDTTGELERQSKVANRPASKTSLPSPTKATAGAAHSECDSTGELERQSKEVHRPATSKLSQITSPTKSSLIPSPTKSSLIPSPSKAPLVSHQLGHSPRPHHCRSPYCASNNPDYATKASPAPRKYLVSKRHLVPGAICTKDPAVLASQSQETATPHAPSTGKPPKPFRKLENALQQPSFTTSVSERSTAPVSYECSPTRIPKPPSARSPGVQESTPLIDQLSSAVSHLIDPASQSPSSPAASQDSDSERSSDDGEFPQERLPESNVDESEHLSRVGSDSSCTVAVASASPRASDAGESSEASVVGTQLDSSSVISAGEPGLEELPVSPESLIQSIPAELPAVTPASDQFSPEPEAPVFAATPSSSVPSSAELEDVTQRFALKLAFETVEETSVQVTECLPTEGVLSADGLEGRTESEEGPSISRDRDAKEHTSTSDSGLRVPEENSDGGDIQTEENSDGEDSQAEENSDGGDSQAEENSVGRIYQAGKTVEGEDFQLRSDVPVFDDTPSSDEMEGQTVPGGRPIASYIEELENAQGKLTEGQREVPKYVRGKGRQLWRSDCRDSREVVFLKQTPQADRRAGGDWMVNDALDGAISRLNSCGKGRVRVLVEAFESMMNLGGDLDSSERRASRVWCLNRMEKGEVDEDGEEFEDGDQRVDCYEVSGDGLQLRASMRLSLGGGNRLPLYHSDEGDEIEMSAIQKVQEWDDDRRESILEEQDQDRGPLRSSQSQPDGAILHDQETHSEGRSANTELTFANLQRRISFSGSHTVLGENDRSSEDSGCEAQTENQFGCYTSDDGQQKADERSTFSLDLDCKYKASRRRRYWKTSSANGEPAGPSSTGGGADKDRRGTRGTMLEPFHLHTEERGMMKEYQFSKKLQQMLEEEDRLRNPIAQGLPWTTDFPEVVPKPSVKEQTRPVEFRHYSNSRAIERADFDSYISERSVYMEMQRQEEERLRIQAEQEEIKRLRREMVPKAQLMPFFDQPFIPTRSSKRLTVPKEPTFLNRQHKRAKCIVWQQQHQHQPFTTQAYQ